jgi:hypothetical protein
MEGGKKTAIAVYVDMNELAWVTEKQHIGYKASALIRHLIQDAIQKEKGVGNGTV